MKRVRILVLAMGMVILVGGTSGQEKKADPKQAPAVAAPAKAEKKSKSRRQIPSGWSKLGLTSEQRKLIYEIDAEYDDKILDLETQIAKMKEDKYVKQVKVLSDDQKKLLQNSKKNP